MLVSGVQSAMGRPPAAPTFLLPTSFAGSSDSPHGTVVDSLTTLPEARFDYYFEDLAAESQEPQGRFWLDDVRCRGPESQLVDCDLGNGFPATADGGGVCGGDSPPPAPLRVACRKFAVPEALEAVTTPGAGASPPEMFLVACPFEVNEHIGKE